MGAMPGEAGDRRCGVCYDAGRCARRLALPASAGAVYDPDLAVRSGEIVVRVSGR
jgi:hypothetical protein